MNTSGTKALSGISGVPQKIAIRRLRDNPGISGKIVIELAIDEFGSVTRACVAESQLYDTALEQNVVDFIKRWNFERVDIPGDVTEVEYPFVFGL